MSNTTARIAMTANASFPRALYRFAQRCGLPQGNAHIAQASEGAPCRQPARQNGPRDGNCQPGSRSFLACISGRIQKPAHPVSDAGGSSAAEPIRICRGQRVVLVRMSWYGHLHGKGDHPSLLARRYRSHGRRDELSCVGHSSRAALGTKASARAVDRANGGGSLRVHHQILEGLEEAGVVALVHVVGVPQARLPDLGAVGVVAEPAVAGLVRPGGEARQQRDAVSFDVAAITTPVGPVGDGEPQERHGADVMTDLEFELVLHARPVRKPAVTGPGAEQPVGHSPCLMSAVPTCPRKIDAR
jgi:hypothetical protein